VRSIHTDRVQPGTGSPQTVPSPLRCAARALRGTPHGAGCRVTTRPVSAYRRAEHAYYRRSDFSSVSNPQLEAQLRRQSLETACESTFFHAKTRPDSLLPQIRGRTFPPRPGARVVALAVPPILPY